jgi:hypothetical protein
MPVVDSRNIVITDNALIVAVSDRSEAESLIAAMIAANIVIDVDDQS